jgi:ABC-2 type transport system permease protein
MNLYVTQIKRELWENKVSFIYTPLVISLLILTFVACAALYSKGFINSEGVHLNFTQNGVPMDAGISVDSSASKIGSQTHKIINEHLDIKNAVMKEPDFFNGVILGVMYSNCVILYLVFGIVLGAYTLRCLFDDRKNKDILFWRSMPVSETTVVLTKLALIFFVCPLVILLLNILVSLAVFIVGSAYLVSEGIALGYLMSSIIKGGAYYIPLQIFYELIFSLIMLLPVIGFALFSSAYAKKTPFFIFMAPVLLVVAEKILNYIFGVSFGIAKIFSLYGDAINITKDAFLLQHPLHFAQAMLLPFLSSIAIGAAFVVAAIWLRNNRYEI